MPRAKASDKRGRVSKEGDTYELVMVRIGGREETFKVSHSGDYYLYRPTIDEKLEHPNLKIVRKKRLIDIRDTIAEMCDSEAPDVIARHTLEEEMMKFLEEKKLKSGSTRAASYANAIYMCHKYVLPFFKGKKIKDITDTDCQRMLNALLEAGYSQSIIDKAYLYLNELLKNLSTRGVVPFNYLTICEKPRPEAIKRRREELSKQKKERHYMTEEEEKQLLTTLYDGYDAEQKSSAGKTYVVHKNFFQPEGVELLLQTGLRCGELCALQWTDWNREKHEVKIQRDRVTYIEREQGETTGHTVTTETAPKNKASAAVISLTTRAQELMELLYEHRYHDSPYVVHTKAGTPISTSVMADRVERVARAAGLVDDAGHVTVTPHDLRHTFAATIYSVSGGDLLATQHRLRHGDPTTTAKVYADIREKREAEIQRKVEEAQAKTQPEK